MLEGKDENGEDKRISSVIKLINVDAQLNFNIITDIISFYLDTENAGRYEQETIEDDVGVKIYLKLSENCEFKICGEVINFASGKLTRFLVDGKYINATANIDNYFEFAKVLGYADKLSSG